MAKKKKRTRRKTTRRAPRAGRGLAKVTVAALQAELNRRLESLQAKRDAVAAELEELETELAAYGGAPAPRRRARVGRPPKRRVGRPAKKKKRVGRPARKKRAGGKRPRNKLNLVDSLAKLLGAEGRLQDFQPQFPHHRQPDPHQQPEDLLAGRARPVHGQVGERRPPNGQPPPVRKPAAVDYVTERAYRRRRA